VKTTVDIRGTVRGLRHREIEEFVALCLLRLRAAKALVRHPDEVSVAFVDDTKMKKLNRVFRGRNATTDVLTFEGDHESLPPGLPTSLGEIVICLDQARRQAREQRHPLATEVRFLLLHGLIHALGFDHEADDGEMDALELRIRPRVGLG
jgi:probable rRNA maturation factor